MLKMYIQSYLFLFNLKKICDCQNVLKSTVKLLDWRNKHIQTSGVNKSQFF